MQATEEINKSLAAMKAILYGEADHEPDLDTIRSLGEEIETAKLGCAMVQSIELLEFEARKDVVQIFSNLLRRQVGVTTNILRERPELLDRLVEGSTRRCFL